MKKPASQAHDDSTRHGENGSSRRHSGSGSAARSSCIRPQATVQRQCQDMADRSPQARQLNALQRMASQGTVRQMVFDTHVKAGRLNVIGEGHDKSESRRKQESSFAKEQGLTYLVENEFGIVKDEQVTMGDPTNLRILFAVAYIKEKFEALMKGVEAPQPLLAGIRWAFVNVQGDVTLHVQDHHDDTLAMLFETLTGAVDKRDQAAAKTAIIDITQVLSPGHTLGSSTGLSRARSESMHAAATEGSESPAMWMIGQSHAKDIDDAFPKRNYVLLDDKSMDAEIRRRG